MPQQQRKEDNSRDEHVESGTFREIISTQGTGSPGASNKRKVDWTRKRQDEIEEPKRERSLRLVDVAELPKRSLKLKLLEEFYDLADLVLPGLDPKEQAITVRVWRNSRGAGKPSCVMSLPELARSIGLSTSGIQLVVGRLIERKILVKGEEIIGKGKKQGVEFSVNVSNK